MLRPTAVCGLIIIAVGSCGTVVKKRPADVVRYSALVGAGDLEIGGPPALSISVAFFWIFFKKASDNALRELDFLSSYFYAGLSTAFLSDLVSFGSPVTPIDF